LKARVNALRLRAELAGGAVTGFDPVVQEAGVGVVFTSAVVQAARPHE
jgi:anaerobic glycerol-3-phosphate dehydrogenase